MSAVVSGRIAVRSIRPTLLERWMLRLATALEAYVSRRLDRRARGVRHDGSGRGPRMSAREECMVRAHSLNLRRY